MKIELDVKLNEKLDIILGNKDVSVPSNEPVALRSKNDSPNIDKTRKQWKKLYYKHCAGIIPTALFAVIAGELKACELPNGQVFRYDESVGKFLLLDYNGNVIDHYNPVDVISYGKTLRRDGSTAVVDPFDDTKYNALKRITNKI